MKTYGGRFLKQKSQQAISAGRELRDAYIIQVFPSLHYCDCKIQGSDQKIVAHYNENWESTPKWLKPGNCARISTPGGTNKGRIEISGHGFAIPTPIPGGSTTPVDEVPTDTVMSGMGVTSDGGGMYVFVGTGTYRIADVIYTLDTIKMDQATAKMDSPAMKMDSTGAIVSFVNPTAGQYRYDLIVIGADGVIDVVQGDDSTGEPVMKDTPSGHVLIGHVFFNPNMADATSSHYRIILSSDIGAYWTASTPSFIRITGTTELAWSTETTQITVTMTDQYGTAMSGTYFLTITEITGNGTISVATDTPIAFNGSMVIDYTRYGEPPGEDVGAESSSFTLAESKSGLVTNLTILNMDNSVPPEQMW